MVSIKEIFLEMPPPPPPAPAPTLPCFFFWGGGYWLFCLTLGLCCGLWMSVFKEQAKERVATLYVDIGYVESNWKQEWLSPLIVYVNRTRLWPSHNSGHWKSRVSGCFETCMKNWEFLLGLRRVLVRPSNLPIAPMDMPRCTFSQTIKLLPGI